MTKENRFKGLMGAVSKNKNVQTSKNLDAQTSSTRKKAKSEEAPPLQGGVSLTAKNIDVETERKKKASSPIEPNKPHKVSDVQTSKSLDAQTSSTQNKVSSRDTLGAPLHDTAVSSRTDVESSKNSDVQTSDNLDSQTSKAKSSNPDYTRTTLYLPKKMHKKLKAIAVEEEREMSQIVEELLSAYLEFK